MKRDKSKSERATAYHEARHAVIAYFMQIPFRKVTIIAGDDYFGKVLYYKLPEWVRPDINSSARISYLIQRRIMVLMAGGIVEKQFTKRYNHVGASYDYKIIGELAGFESGSAKQMNAYIVHRWKFIEKLAEKLLEKKELSYKSIRELFLEPIRNL